MNRVAKSKLAKQPKPKRHGGLTGQVLVAAMQVSRHRDIDIEPRRTPMPVRDIFVAPDAGDVSAFHRASSPPAMTADRLGNLDAKKIDGDVKAALEDHRFAKSFADRHV
jgi:hypothetical protein